MVVQSDYQTRFLLGLLWLLVLEKSKKKNTLPFSVFDFPDAEK